MPGSKIKRNLMFLFTGRKKDWGAPTKKAARGILTEPQYLFTQTTNGTLRKSEAGVSPMQGNILTNKTANTYIFPANWLKFAEHGILVAKGGCYRNVGFNHFYPIRVMHDASRKPDLTTNSNPLKRSQLQL